MILIIFVSNFQAKASLMYQVKAKQWGEGAEFESKAQSFEDLPLFGGVPDMSEDFTRVLLKFDNFEDAATATVNIMRVSPQEGR